MAASFAMEKPRQRSDTEPDPACGSSRITPFRGLVRIYTYLALSRHRDRYRAFVDAFAGKVVDLARAHTLPRAPLPALEPLPALDEIGDAFKLRDPAAPPPVARRGPRYTKFVYVAGRRDELAALRQRLDAYGAEGGLDWHPYHPDAEDEVAMLAQQVASTAVAQAARADRAAVAGSGAGGEGGDAVGRRGFRWATAHARRGGNMVRSLRLALTSAVAVAAALSCANSRAEAPLPHRTQWVPDEELAIEQFVSVDYLSRSEARFGCVEYFGRTRVVSGVLPDGSVFTIRVAGIQHGGTGTVAVERRRDGRMTVRYAYPLTTGDGQVTRYGEDGSERTTTTLPPHDERNAIVQRLGRRAMELELPCS
jgi:hypothetical protein